MSLLTVDAIKVIAESIGIGKLSDEAAAVIAPDAEYRLRELAQEALKFMRHSKRDVLTTEDVRCALKLRSVEALYGFNSAQEPLNFARAAGSSDLYYLEDKDVDLTDIIAAPLPACPIDYSLSIHWLAVEGVQPAIPQNPSIEVITKKRKPTIAEKIPEVKPVIEHILSRELQLYYEKITDAIKSKDQPLKESALSSLEIDTGIHTLVPYFTQFIADEVSQNLKSLPLLESLMHMAFAMLKNESLNIEPYLHHLMPSVLTCLVGKKLCEAPDEDHWKLRDYAAEVIAFVSGRWGKTYSTLLPRLTKTLLNAFLDPSRPLTTHYGGVRGLGALGQETILLSVLPNVAAYMQTLRPDLEPTSPRHGDARRVRQALMEVCAQYMRTLLQETASVAAATGTSVSPLAAGGQQDLAGSLKRSLEVTSAEARQYYQALAAEFGQDFVALLTEKR
jgi:transcription initiation factor TFIID subunit 6